MVNILLRYGVALHLALLVAYASWARGGSAPAYFWALPWLALGMLEMMFLLPPSHSADRPKDAWRRQRRGLLRDPVLYIGAVLVVFLAIQWLNGPRELKYEAATASWAYAPPPWDGWPFCVVRAEALQVLLWGLTVYAILLAVRHGTNRAGKLLLLRLIVVNGALLSILGLLQFATGTGKLFWVREVGTFFFSTFGYPNHAGAYFTLLTALSGGLLLYSWSGEEGRRHVWWLGLTLALNALGAIFSLSRAAIVLTGALLLAGSTYGLLYLWPRIRPSDKLCLGIGATVVLALGALLYFAVPNNPVRKEVRTVNLLKLHEEFVGDRQLLSNAAMDIWQDYPWVGVGGWGFRRYVALYLGKEHWDYLRNAGRANVHNDPIQYLCEHGIVGAGLMLALIFTLVAQLWIRLAQMPPDDTGKKPRGWFMRVSPIVWAILAGTTATVLHSLIDLPFRSIAIMSVWFIALACAPAFVPRRKTQTLSVQR
ncbi:MAG: O-antigen ligase family protein [Kiritimatiellae bacterium]|nr:O-antigen ligase family protein [Kiritimatiellia bacterium]